MYKHHRESLDQLVEVIKSDPEFLAIITSGSIAQGKAKEGSDIDVYLVLTDEAYERRKKVHSLAYNNRDVCNYPDGYIDGKMINRQFLELAAIQGSEPTRYSFVGSQVVWSRLPDLEQLIQRIPEYPEQHREGNIQDFYAQLLLYAFYFSGEAAQKNNPYLMLHSASNTALFGARIVLAYNRTLFPCHKGLREAVASVPDQPEAFMQHWDSLLDHPSAQKCMELAKLLLGHYKPELAFDQAVSMFVSNNEWNWLDHEPPIADR
ncbi:nucleotidyltransferase domain-containing protein [Paenibacillus hubeiensis]|uniref:nucleotidyltransferase domain-containing protein n=1 Tax=Paenibacillus hubeiensis TaxID=3077330 RepID=UPI0031BB69DF